MPLFRLLLAWLVLAALPLQGFAATSMLYCGPASGAPQLAGTPAHRHGEAVAPHDHASPKVVAAQSHHADASGALPDAAHECGVCASCCGSMAIASSSLEMAPAAPPGIQPGAPFAPLLSPPATVPDKPPRG